MDINVFQTLADPTRCSIVEALRDDERSVGDIVERVGIRQSGVSRHLRILQEAGFVSVRPEGSRRVYSLRQEPFEELEHWAHSYRAVWEARLLRFESALDRSESP